MIWLVFAGMTLAVLGTLLWPLWRTRVSATNNNLHVGIYRAQIAEIDGDLASGRIAPEEAQAARAETGRRLVAEGETLSTPTTSRPRRALASAIMGAACFAGLLLYTRIGSPDLADAPLEARRAPSQGMDFASALTGIEAHLAKQPDDLRGWTIIAPVYLRMGRADDAVTAYANILRLGGDDAEHRANYAEAQIYAANGIVTADARRNFDAALALDAKSAKARYYLGLAAEQDGESAKARDIWSALAADSPAGSPLAAALAQRIAAMEGPAGNPGMAADIASLPQDAQQAAISGMVEKLAGRLRDKSDDIEGWLRLVRAYRVLNEQDKAKAALVDARKTFARDDAAMTRLDALARELGLEG